MLQPTVLEMLPKTRIVDTKQQFVRSHTNRKKVNFIVIRQKALTRHPYLITMIIFEPDVVQRHNQPCLLLPKTRCTWLIGSWWEAVHTSTKIDFVIVVIISTAPIAFLPAVDVSSDTSVAWLCNQPYMMMPKQRLKWSERCWLDKVWSGTSTKISLSPSSLVQQR